MDIHDAGAAVNANGDALSTRRGKRETRTAVNQLSIQAKMTPSIHLITRACTMKGRLRMWAGTGISLRLVVVRVGVDFVGCKLSRRQTLSIHSEVIEHINLFICASFHLWQAEEGPDEANAGQTAEEKG